MSTYTVFSRTSMHQSVSLIKSCITSVMLLLVLCFLIPDAHTQEISSEYYSSTDSLQNLVTIEIGLVDAFRKYIQTQEEEFAYYHKFIEHVKTQHGQAEKDMEDYLGNPINAFTLIKRMVVDWNQLHQFIKESDASIGLREAIEKIETETPLPTTKEIKGAVGGLARLQKIYNLDTKDLVNGNVNGKDYGIELNWKDCFEIATQLYDMREIKMAISWLHATLEQIEKIGDENEDKNESQLHKFKLDTLEYLALAYYDIGLPKRAVTVVDSLLEIEPDHTFKELRSYILSVPPNIDDAASPTTDGDTKLKKFSWYSNYTRLCQGVQITEKKLHQLKCRLETHNKPAFQLAPLKVEELSLDPAITQYHNLINDSQIDKILEESQNFVMERSGVYNGNDSVIEETRVSQQIWLLPDNPVVKSLYYYVGKISGLDMKDAEWVQVANYGIGGQYDPHYDFFLEGTEEGKNNRIATAMFYLSNVEQGGYTAFPLLNLYLRPEKGSLVLWYNLHRSLALDKRTLHGGCPVLKGSKKIGNIWIHRENQEFTRPCLLFNDGIKCKNCL